MGYVASGMPDYVEVRGEKNINGTSRLEAVNVPNGESTNERWRERPQPVNNHWRKMPQLRRFKRNIAQLSSIRAGTR
jgi:hypothetical protein